MSQHYRRSIVKKDSRPNLTQSVDERIQSTASIPPPPSGRPVSSKYTAPQGSSGYRHPSALYHRPEQSPNQRRENEYEQDIIYEQEDRRKELYRTQQGAHDIYCHISKDSSRPEVYYSIPATSEFLDATGYHIPTRDQSASRIQREPDPEEGWTSHESEYTGSIAPSSSGFTDETSSSYRDHGRPANPEYEHVTRSIHQNTDLRERCRSSSPMRSYDRLYPYNHQKYPTTSSKDHPSEAEHDGDWMRGSEDGSVLNEEYRKHYRGATGPSMNQWYFQSRSPRFHMQQPNTYGQLPRQQSAAQQPLSRQQLRPAINYGPLAQTQMDDDYDETDDDSSPPFPRIKRRSVRIRPLDEDVNEREREHGNSRRPI